MTKIKLILITIIFLLFPITTINAETKEASFYKCVDGDTAKVKINNKVKTLRFLAIDTPETKHPTKSEEAYGKEASDYTCTRLQEAKQITLEYDLGSDKQDKYDRDLVWVFVDNSLLQEELLKKGYAKVEYLYGDYKYTDKLLDVEKEAKKNKVGIWSDYEDYDIYIAYVLVILVILGIVFKKIKVKLVFKQKK